MPRRELDRSSFVPLYYQLAEILKERLEAGTWRPGSRFPSERELAEEFGISRTVIRPALDLLEGDGAIRRIKGAGTFVMEAKRRIRVLGLTHLFSGGDSDGISVEVLEVKRRGLDPQVRRVLGLEAREPIANVVAVMHLDGDPVCVCDSYSPEQEVPWLMEAAEASGTSETPPAPEPDFRLGRTEVSIEASFFGPWEASQVGVSAGDLTLMARLLQFGRRSDEKEERAVELARLVYRGDSVQLSTDRG